LAAQHTLLRQYKTRPEGVPTMEGNGDRASLAYAKFLGRADVTFDDEGNSKEASASRS